MLRQALAAVWQREQCKVIKPLVGGMLQRVVEANARQEAEV